MEQSGASLLPLHVPSRGNEGGRSPPRCCCSPTGRRRRRGAQPPCLIAVAHQEERGRGGRAEPLPLLLLRFVRKKAEEEEEGPGAEEEKEGGHPPPAVCCAPGDRREGEGPNPPGWLRFAQGRGRGGGGGPSLLTVVHLLAGRRRRSLWPPFDVRRRERMVERSLPWRGRQAAGSRGESRKEMGGAEPTLAEPAGRLEPRRKEGAPLLWVRGAPRYVVGFPLRWEEGETSEIELRLRFQF